MQKLGRYFSHFEKKKKKVARALGVPFSRRPTAYGMCFGDSEQDKRKEKFLRSDIRDE
jgi:hypothetical protein